ncbi:hypothetical protein HAT2_00680 [Candidatus Similichlamydia laticola]|uniref:Uncharacterized protein n=1 Tax=Candidatus Similichlamydia laticola TaxID=2170265 RepID=A0A369KCL9_9BACT|nr:hypothetical protein HAT2_00680 [Candidatus Similichlamydia laticola]
MIAPRIAAEELKCGLFSVYKQVNHSQLILSLILQIKCTF